MVKGNDVIPNAHFHKHWQFRVRTWFNQPGRKKSRRIARANKAAAIAPRPVSGSLRPVVRPPTVRYNMKPRLGRGFSIDEVKAAGYGKAEARSFGIAIDCRRKNKSEESFQLNVQRLKEYRARLVVFPRGRKPKAGDASKEARASAEQITGVVMPIKRVSPKTRPMMLTADLKAAKAKATLRMARTIARSVGKRLAKAKAAAGGDGN